MDLKDYFLNLSQERRAAFAKSCDTTVKQLLNISYGDRPCSPDLAINIERESGGKVRVETLAPQSKNKPVDWAYIRGTRRRTETRA